MNINAEHSQIYLDGTYLMQFHGTLKTNTIAWRGQISVASLEQGASLQVTLLLQPEFFHVFLSQFQNLDINAQPLDLSESNSMGILDDLDHISGGLSDSLSLQSSLQISQTVSKEVTDGARQ